MQLNTNIERHEIVSRDHHQHAECGEDHEPGILELFEPLPFSITVGDDKSQRSADKHEPLHKVRKGVRYEEPAEGKTRLTRRHEQQQESAEHPEQRNDRREFVTLILAAPKDANH